MEVNGVKRNDDGTFVAGTIPNPNGRPPETPEQKIIKKATKQLIAEYKEKLTEALSQVEPVLIAKAIGGDIQAIKELHDRSMGKPEQHIETDLNTNLPLNIIIKNGGTN